MIARLQASGGRCPAEKSVSIQSQSSEQRSARASERGGDARPKRHGPVVTQRFLPDQRHDARPTAQAISTWSSGDAGGQNPTKDFLDLRLAAAGVKQHDPTFAGSAAVTTTPGVIRNASGFVPGSAVSR